MWSDEESDSSADVDEDLRERLLQESGFKGRELTQHQIDIFYGPECSEETRALRRQLLSTQKDRHTVWAHPACWLFLVIAAVLGVAIAVIAIAIAAGGAGSSKGG